MKQLASAPQLIEKEQISHLSFPEGEVLSSSLAIEKRASDLKNAAMYGNSAHYKVKIVFEDEIGLKSVETTVWGIKGRQVELKGKLAIPICRVHEVKI